MIALAAQQLDVLRIVVLQGGPHGPRGRRSRPCRALVLTRIMKSLLYEVSPTDITTFALVALMVLALIRVACLVPSLRATRINPIVSLRYE